MDADVAILGAGISGLATAFELKNLSQGSLRIALFEKSNRAGGYIQTINKERFQFELGPNSIRTRGSGLAALDLALKLGLQDEIIFPSKESRNRFVLQNGELVQMPRVLSLFSALLREPFVKKSLLDDESVKAFFSRRFSPKIDTLVDAFVTGIFAGDSALLSMRSCFSELFHREKKYRSLLLSLLFNKKKKSEFQSEGSFFSFRSGMETLPLALQKHLEGSISFGEEAVKIEYDKGWTIHFKSGKKIHAKKLVSALPLPSLKKLISPIDEIPHASVAVVPVAFESKDIVYKKGFGYLVPSKEKSPLLGVIFNEAIFPGSGFTKMTLMLGGIRNLEVLKKSDGEILDLGLQELFKHLNSKPAKPVYTHVHRADSAIPQYPVGYYKALERFSLIAKEQLPHFAYTGTGFAGVSIGDLITNAKLTAKEILANWI